MTNVSLILIFICFSADLAKGGFFVPKYVVISRYRYHEERFYPELKWITTKYNGSDENGFHMLNDGSFAKIHHPSTIVDFRQRKQYLGTLFRKTCRLSNKTEECLWFSVALPPLAKVQMNPYMKVSLEEPTSYYVRDFCKMFAMDDPFNIFTIADFLSEEAEEYSGDGNYEEPSAFYYHYVSNLSSYTKPNFKPFCEIWVKTDQNGLSYSSD